MLIDFAAYLRMRTLSNECNSCLAKTLPLSNGPLFCSTTSQSQSANRTADRGGVAFKVSYSSSCNGPVGPLRDSYNATAGEDAAVALSSSREGKE